MPILQYPTLHQLFTAVSSHYSSRYNFSLEFSSEGQMYFRLCEKGRVQNLSTMQTSQINLKCRSESPVRAVGPIAEHFHIWSIECKRLAKRYNHVQEHWSCGNVWSVSLWQIFLIATAVELTPGQHCKDRLIVPIEVLYRQGDMVRHRGSNDSIWLAF